MPNSSITTLSLPITILFIIHQIDYHKQTTTKWLSFCRRHFQMHFCERTFYLIYLLWLKFQLSLLLGFYLACNASALFMWRNSQTHIFFIRLKWTIYDFQTWYLIGWRYSRQPIRGHVRKLFFINADLKCILLRKPDSRSSWRHQMEAFSASMALCERNASLVDSPHKVQWRGALMFSLICGWINSSANNRAAGDLRRHHYDVTVMMFPVAIFIHFEVIK